jgi:hypothetical protein
MARRLFNKLGSRTVYDFEQGRTSYDKRLRSNITDNFD